jgi:hypothetical protein
MSERLCQWTSPAKRRAWASAQRLGASIRRPADRGRVYRLVGIHPEFQVEHRAWDPKFRAEEVRHPSREKYMPSRGQTMSRPRVEDVLPHGEELEAKAQARKDRQPSGTPDDLPIPTNANRDIRDGAWRGFQGYRELGQVKVGGTASETPLLNLAFSPCALNRHS